MSRFGFSWNSEKEDFDDRSRSIVDPTPLTSDPLVNGATVTVPTAGSGKSQIYLTLPKYQFIANGYYQGPWGVNVGANWTLRQGYSQMFFADNVAVNETVYQQKDVLVVGSNVGKYRLPNVSTLDARFEKQIRSVPGTCRSTWTYSTSWTGHRSWPAVQRPRRHLQRDYRDYESAHRAVWYAFQFLTLPGFQLPVPSQLPASSLQLAAGGWRLDSFRSAALPTVRDERFSR